MVVRSDVWSVSPHAFVASKSAIYMAELEDGVRLYAGAAKLIPELAASVPLAVASGAPRQEIDVALAEHQLAHHFAAIVSGDDVDRGKPYDAPYLAALRGLQQAGHPELTAASCIAIEDTAVGVDAALAAGMACVAVAHSRPQDALKHAPAVVPALSALSLADLKSVQKH